MVKGTLDGRCEYAWTKARLTSKQCYDGDDKPTWRTEAVYDCRTLRRLASSANRSGALGTPGQ